MSGKGKERHLFLFKDKLMITKKKKPKKPGEPVTYEFKMLIDVSHCTLLVHLSICSVIIYMFAQDTLLSMMVEKKVFAGKSKKKKKFP